MSNYGFVGTFYFGPINATISTSALEVSSTLLQPTVTIVNAVSATVYPTYLSSRYVLLQPSVFTSKDISISFVGVPLSGPSPLVVQYTATVDFAANFKNKYRVTSYRWCFNYDYDNDVCLEDWVITTDNPTTHVYRGYAGQKFSVKLCVSVELI